MAQGTAARSDEHGRSSGVESARLVGRSAMRLLARVIRFVCGIFAAVLIAQILLVVLGANPRNSIAEFFAGASARLDLGIGELFVPASESLRVALNLGLAALIWLAIGAVLVRVVRALTP